MCLPRPRGGPQPRGARARPRARRPGTRHPRRHPRRRARRASLLILVEVDEDGGRFLGGGSAGLVRQRRLERLVELVGESLLAEELVEFVGRLVLLGGGRLGLSRGAGLDPGQRVDRCEARLGQLGIDELVVGGSVGLGRGVLELGLDVEHFGRLVGNRVALLGGGAGVGDRLVLHRRVLLLGRAVVVGLLGLGGLGLLGRLLQIGDVRGAPPARLLVGLLPRLDLRGDEELGRRLGERIRLVRPLRRPKGLVLEPFNLGFIRAMGALQFQVLSDCVVEDAHGDSVRLAKTMRLSFRLRANGINFPATHHGAIAQLAERLDRTQEVGGSNPPSSIDFSL